MLWPLRPPVPLGNIPRNYPTCPLPWGSLSQLPSRYFHRPTEMDAKLRASRERPHDSAGGEGIRRHRIRFSVRVRTQNASFRRVHLSLPGQTWRCLTEKRTPRSPDRTDCVFPSRRGAREVWGNHPPGCGALWKMAQLGKCARATPRQAAGRVARVSADLGSEPGLTERRTLPNRWVQNALFRHDATAECAFP